MNRHRAAVAISVAAALVAVAAIAGLVVRSTQRSSGAEQASAATRPVEVWAFGDGADRSPAVARVARMVVAARPARMIYLGDVYDRGTREEYRRNYAPLYGSLARRTLPTPGNHEWPLHREGYDPYWKSVTGQAPRSNYATRLGGWEVLSLNSEAVSPTSPQVRWLRQRVASGGNCRIAFWHRPRFSAGSHGDQADIDAFWRPLRNRAALVLNGHEHNMQEMRPRDGIRQIVSGAGGHGLYPVRRADSRLAWANSTDYGALRLRLRPGLAEYAFVAADGRVLRRGSARCRAG